MGTANHLRVELAASPPCEAYRPLVTGSFDGRVFLLNARSSRTVAIAAFILAASLVGFATNLSMQLLNLRMQALGISGFGIGLSVAAQALGILVTAPLTKHIIAYRGIRETILGAALVASTVLLSFTFVTDLFS